jgi:nitroreductase
MRPALTADELLTTTRAVRKRLDLSRPVGRDVVMECLRIAFQAPNASDRQTWSWVVVDDAALRAEMAAIYRACARDRAQIAAATGATPPMDPLRQARLASSAAHLVEHMAEVPVLVVATFEGRFEHEPVARQAAQWGSIGPAMWSFMLALRTRGLGSVWTTIHLDREREMGELLGIPATETQAGLFPVAYTIGTDFRPADRSASESRVRWNHW